MTESEEERARRILAGVISPRLGLGAGDGSWTCAVHPEHGAIVYVVSTEQGLISFNIHNPEKLAISFLAAAEKAHEAIVRDAKTNQPLLGTVLGHDLTQAVETTTHNTLEILVRILGPKIFEMLQEATDEAMLLTEIASDTFLRRNCDAVAEGLVQREESARTALLNELVDEGTRRRKARLHQLLEHFPSDDEIVARALSLCREGKKRYANLTQLAHELNERYDYKLSGDAVRQRFIRAGVRWGEVKSGQKKT